MGLLADHYDSECHIQQLLLDTQDNKNIFFLFSSIIGVTISFDRGMYSVGENDGSVQISASLVQGELQRPVEVLFSTQSGTATSEDPKDFQSLQNVALQFDELLIRNQVSVTIINDNIFEDEERFFASLVTNDADVDFGNKNATITIVDDGDGKSCNYYKYGPSILFGEHIV